MLSRAVLSQTSKTRLALRYFSITSSPPPPAPAKTPFGEDPETFEPSRAEKRLHSRTNAESQYKLGKHRSNALDLISKFPIVEVEGERAICDGGGGPLGHPLEYISLERPGEVVRCKYCGLGFKSKSWEKH